MPYGDIGGNMNKARVAEAVRGFIPTEKSFVRQSLIVGSNLPVGGAPERIKYVSGTQK